jgi:serine/threonine protein kinase
LQSHSLGELSEGAARSAAEFDPGLAITIDNLAGAMPADSPAERPLPGPGDRFGNYYILRTLGKGGMGAVFEADQLETGRRVALKVLKHSLDSPEARKRFLREGRLAASVNHPNSVYIFGTEDIGGTPAIAMELVAGGTLQDWIKSCGPLPIGAAVDVILQIIAGLEAAQKAGVLHRDIKPANCFIDANGTVKVGDFGLSISKSARGDTDVTRTGAVLGTPAFASPEQLRGDELNVRSDIYAVGVTLYYLLTSRTPFDADNLVKLLATVLEQPAPSPRKWRPEIPRSLAAVLLRCLEKQPADRFRDYHELRQALFPFASVAPAPATLGLRLVANVVDGMVLQLLSMLLSALWLWKELPSFEEHGWFPVALALYLVVDTVYYAIPEGLWGFSFGKILCGLRVIGRDRAAPGIMRAAGRAAFVLVGSRLPTLIFQATGSFSPDPTQVFFWLLSLGLMLWSPFWGVLLFIAARRTNGYAGLHDLLTGTRVISREAYQARAALSQADEMPAVSESTPRIGPYHVLKTFGQHAGEEWLLGYDTRLLRRVWIHNLPTGKEPVEASLRGIGRAGRLRWLAGRRSLAENWDAYEAASGQALESLLDRPQPWCEVRFWLLDLAEELAAAAKDGTVPSRLAIDRLWITAEGRAKLLDFLAPGVAPRDDQVDWASSNTGDLEATRRFLGQIASAALEGRISTVREATSAAPATPVPLSAREFFVALPEIPSLEPAVESLRGLVRSPADASRARLSLLAALCLPPLAVGVLWLLIMFLGIQMLKKMPDYQPMLQHLMALENLKRPALQREKTGSRLKGTAEEIVALERYIVYRFGKVIRDRPFMAGVPKNWRKLADEAILAHPRVTEDEFYAAEKIIEPLKLTVKGEDRSNPLIDDPMKMIFMVTSLVCCWLLVTAILSIAAAIACRGGLLLWALGLAVVRNDGRPASRWRIFWRALIAWLPLFLLPFALLFGSTALVSRWPAGGSSLAITVGAIVAVACLALVVWSTLLPGRGIADRLAGTWLVPK